HGIAEFGRGRPHDRCLRRYLGAAGQRSDFRVRLHRPLHQLAGSASVPMRRCTRTFLLALVLILGSSLRQPKTPRHLGRGYREYCLGGMELLVTLRRRPSPRPSLFRLLRKEFGGRHATGGRAIMTLAKHCSTASRFWLRSSTWRRRMPRSGLDYARLFSTFTSRSSSSPGRTGFGSLSSSQPRSASMCCFG